MFIFSIVDQRTCKSSKRKSSGEKNPEKTSFKGGYN